MLRTGLDHIRRQSAWLAIMLVVAACSSASDQISTIATSPSDDVPTPSSAATVPAITKAVATDQPSTERPNTTSPKDRAEETTNASATTSSVTATLSTEPDQVPSTTIVPAEPPESLRFVEVAKGARNPIFLTAAPGAGHSYLAEQGGRIHYMTNDQLADRPVLDITEKVTFRGEQGLLGIALHPQQPTRLFVHYSDRIGHTVVSEFSLSDNGKTADPDSETIIFTATQPATNHNGGMIQFGPDGYLYLGLGDGGRAGDYYGHGQRPDTPLAALVRIDPDQATSQVWWYGLRNPWRFWIDGPTGLTYIADVGQDAYEEIDVAPLSEQSLNFGWPITEGLHCYNPTEGCDTTGLTMPVLEIAHDDGGTCSITGGVVYRGSLMPGLWGHYFYSDYCGGYLRSFHWNGTLATDLQEWAPDLGAVVSFGTDGLGEMYVLTTDTVYRIEPGP